MNSEHVIGEGAAGVPLVVIAAMGRNRVLAREGRIPWRLPRDVSWFRERAAGRWLLLGRTTFEQMRGWFQPGQVPVVLTSRTDYPVPGGWAVSSMREARAVAAAQDAGELLVCGGGEVYAAAVPLAAELLLTIVDLEPEGDVWFPEFSKNEWAVAGEQFYPADAEHEAAMTIRRFVRTLNTGSGGLRLPDAGEKRF